MMTSAEIRQQYLDFFRSKEHIIVPSAPIVVKNDPTLLFTNAGMNQFKDYFLGNKQAPNNRVADTQKCLRVSGKHNDLEEVGVDTYHHTMFEMLGNWSFGDYFKKEAIAWSWELLTDVYKLDKNKLYVTIFEGDDKEGLPKDDEAFNEWKKYIAEDRILLGNKKDNFWEMGDTGPCGPCTEIHVDCRTTEERKAVDGKTLVNNDHPQVIEIWNNVFMQFNRVWSNKPAFDEWTKTNPNSSKEERAKKILEFTKLIELPAQHVDTGMGFERLVRVIQQKQSNYDTDVFTGTIAALEKITNKKYDYSDSKEAVSFRVIADHIRAISFTIADDQLPSNTGAGYVIRRILRRAVRYYYSYLDYNQPLLHQLLPVIAKQFENVFPELKQQHDFVSKVVKEEEDAFLRTLEKGLKRIDELPKFYWSEMADNIFGDQYDLEDDAKANYVHAKKNEFVLKNISDKTPIKISGKIAFEMFDTFGFPIDLTRLIANENNWEIDEDEFEKELQKQKNRSRAAREVPAGDWLNFTGSDNLGNSEEGKTSDEYLKYLNDKRNEAHQNFDTEESSPSPFVGYHKLEHKTRVTKIRKVKIKDKDACQIVLEETPFYAESGGQVGDTGWLYFGSDIINVIDTKKENDLIIHFTETIPVEINGEVIAKVDAVRRKNIALHHSVTHLMHAALRAVLGKHVAQKGSLVNEEHLRFDFSHFAKVTEEEIEAVEKLVNEKIRENIPVVIKEMPKDDAIKMGAMALFGEKYGDIVRVVIIDPNYSVELCGGTHVGATGELGWFKIKSESAIAAGVRRIEAVCGRVAEELVNALFSQIMAIRLKPSEISKSFESLRAENTSLKKHIEALEARQLVIIRNELLQKDEIINNVTFVGEIIEVSSADALKKLCFELKNKLHDHVAVLCANIDGKPFVAIGISDTVVAAKNLDAGKIIKEHVAPLIKGGGGGQKNLATAGGQDISNLKAVIEKVKSLL